MRRLTLLALTCAIAACSPGNAPPQAEADANGTDADRAAAESLTDGAQIDVLKQRVATLENEMIELKANPQTIDLELLTKRVEQLEVGAATATPAAPPAEPTRAPQTDPAAAQRAVDAAIAERRSRRNGQD